MLRSFTDRILGGVCGGLADNSSMNVWWLRGAFIVLTPVTWGAVALVYIALWWMMPQDSLIAEHKRSTWRVFLALVSAIVILGTWVIEVMGWSEGVFDHSIFVPVLALTMSGLFLLRQVGE